MVVSATVTASLVGRCIHSTSSKNGTVCRVPSGIHTVLWHLYFIFTCICMPCYIMIALETKYRAIVHYERFLRSIRKVAKIYGVSRSSLHRWLHNGKPTNRKRRQKKAFRQEIVDCIDSVLRSNPCADMQQVCDAIKTCCTGIIPSSTNTVGRWVRGLGYTRKKVKTIVDYSPPVELTNSFCSKYKMLADDQIVCIDEAGFYVGAHNRYGYAPRGKRIHVAASRTLRRSRFTLIMAVGSSGIVHYNIIDGNCHKNDFIQFIKELPPGCVTGKTIVMDNLRCHHSKETLSAISALECQALFIPPYSPRYNAIEYVFSTLKRMYRRECGEQCIPLETRCADDYVDILVACLESCGGFHAFFRRVKASVAHYCDHGIFERYD